MAPLLRISMLIVCVFTHFARVLGASVTTTSGTVQGQAVKWPPNSSVVEYLGIPYAQNPTGRLRFSAPVAYTSSQALNTSAFSVDCLQFSGDPGSLISGAPPSLQAYSFGMGGGAPGAPHQYGENCLSINVWTKPGGTSNKAVMVWIYGGGFSSGTSNAAFYNGARLAQDEDVVFVSLNYRIGFWGFPHAPGLPNQNLGLLDQRLAIEWVRDNIAGFGGDPKRITLFGESAGGASVDLFSYAWTKDPIVNGFIAQSGTAIISLIGAPLTVYDDWYQVSNYTGCGGPEAGPNATLACMRAASPDAILAALGEQNPSTSGLGMQYGPVADGKVVFEDNKARGERGEFIRRPMLNGNNDYELGLISGGAGAYFGSWLQSLISGPATGSAINFAGNAAFGCPAAVTSAMRTKNNVPNWRYRFMPVYENTAISPQSGAYHSMDVPFTTGTNALRPFSPPMSPEQYALETYMVHAWAEFAKDPDAGLSRLGWPTYDPEGDTLIRLGYNNLSALNVGPSTEYDTACALVGP